MESSHDKINCNQLTYQPKSLSKAWGSVINLYLSAKLRRDRKISKYETLGFRQLYFPSFMQGVKKEQHSTEVFLFGLFVCVCLSCVSLSGIWYLNLWDFPNLSVTFWVGSLSKEKESKLAPLQYIAAFWRYKVCLSEGEVYAGVCIWNKTKRDLSKRCFR